MDIPKKYNKYLPEPKTFQGFPPEPANNYWRYPRCINGWWASLSGSEQKVLDYIVRHTWGYNKETDQISFSQFSKGIYSKRKKEWIDKGIGLETQAISGAIKGLEKKGFIVVKKRAGKTTIYRLKTTSL